MKRFLIFLTVSFCLQGTPSGNPIDILSLPAVTEVYWVSPEEWYIEIDGSICLSASNETAPCTSSSFDFYIGSDYSRGFRTTLEFNADRYAVLTGSSLQDLPENEPVLLQQTDLVGLTCQDVSWQFQLRETLPGNTLVRVGNSEAIYESRRKSLGSRGDYDTRYEFTLLDNRGNLLDRIYASNRFKTSTVDSFVYIGGGYSTETGLRACEVPLSMGNDTIEMVFYDSKAGHIIHSENCIKPVQCTYFDSIPLIRDTIVLPLTNYELTVLDKNLQVIPKLRAYRRHSRETTGTGTPVCDSALVFCEKFPGESTSLYKIRVHKEESPVFFSFFSYDTGTPVFSLTYYNETWTGTYVDSIGLIRDTLVITPIAATTAAPVLFPREQPVFNVFPAPGGEILYTISTPVSIPHFSFSVYTLDGRKLGTERFTVKSAGTCSHQWHTDGRQKHMLTPGTYLCRFESGNYPVQTQQILIR